MLNKINPLETYADLWGSLSTPVRQILEDGQHKYGAVCRELGNGDLLCYDTVTGYGIVNNHSKGRLELGPTL